MKILYLCNKKYYDTKMSRVRFHSITALEKICDLKWSGIGWKNYDQKLTVQENIEKIYEGSLPDAVIAYKPLEMKEYYKISPLRCIRYNEMWDKEWTMKEIINSKSNLVICHHEREAIQYSRIFENFNLFPVSFENVSHCAEKTIFKDYGMEKKYDVLLVGDLSPKFYPLRQRLTHIIAKMKKKYNCEIFKHPSYDVADASNNRCAVEYAKSINSSKIVVTCSSIYKYRLGKYIEIPMCNAALAGDKPLDEKHSFDEFLIEINESMTDEEIIKKLEFFLENEDKRKNFQNLGMKYSQGFTQEKYAQRLLEKIRKYL
tara:strand:+ start:187 stop:1134 length:948 start_codon:yes stop_codon:yes gene_type:complete